MHIIIKFNSKARAWERIEEEEDEDRDQVIIIIKLRISKVIIEIMIIMKKIL